MQRKQHQVFVLHYFQLVGSLFREWLHLSSLLPGIRAFLIQIPHSQTAFVERCSDFVDTLRQRPKFGREPFLAHYQLLAAKNG